jgi:hypothetical protein
MTGRSIITLRGDVQRDYAKTQIDTAPVDYVVKISPPTRNLEQNAKLHAMITDIVKQDTPISHHSIESIKLIFMHELRAEARYLPTLDGDGMFPVGQRTSLLSKRPFAALIEIIYAYGARHNVIWTEPDNSY